MKEESSEREAFLSAETIRAILKNIRVIGTNNDPIINFIIQLLFNSILALAKQTAIVTITATATNTATVLMSFVDAKSRMLNVLAPMSHWQGGE